jgi:CRP-like cAMP-binding protein
LRKRLGTGAGFAPVEKKVDTSKAHRPLGLAERIMLLRSTMNFAQARIEALSDVAQECREITLDAGAELWKVGSPATFMLVLENGTLDCTTEDGAQRFEMGPQSLAGGLDALAGEPRWYDAVAATPLRALRIEIQSLLDVIEDNMEMAVDMLRVFAQVILELEDRAAPGNPAVAESSL